jgi:phosphoglycerol transferase
LKISQLFIPRQGHRVAKLAAFSDRSQGRGGLLAAFESESGQQLGLFGAFGVATAMVALTCRVAANGRRRWLDRDDVTTTVHLGLLSVLCMVVGAMGGLSYIISSAGLRDIRSWNRISIVIAFCGVVVSSLVLERLIDACRARWRASRPWLAKAAPAVLVVAVAGVAYLDQAGRDLPDYAAVEAKDASLSRFFGGVHHTLGDGAAVYMLPYNGFPETPSRQRMGPYDQAAGFIYEPRLNYSWGFMRGRHPDYPYALAEQPAEEWLTSVAAVGFTGVTLDRFGYTDDERAARESELTALVGPAASLSADGRYAFYDLRAYAVAVRQRLGDAALRERARQTLALVPKNPPPGG